MCTYHGWTYDLKGQLVGVPGFKDYYHEDLDREQWGLVAAPHVESYKGFVFANLDPEAPGLDEYLGEVGKIGLSMLGERGEDVRVISGVQKYTIGCNWKFAVDNNFDWAHVNVTHSSAIMARPYNRLASNQGGTPQAPGAAPGLDRQDMTSIFGEYGHAIGGPAYVDEPTGAHAWWRNRPEARKALGPVGMKSAGHPNIFPNAWVACNSNQLIVRHPKGPHKTEMWMYVLIDHSLKERDPDRWERLRFGSIHGHGPAGMFEMEDGENWDQSTRGMSGAAASKYPLHFAMNLGHGQVIDEEGGPPYVQSKVNEHPQLWVWRCWADWMDAESWSDLKANHTLVPDVV
jgi:3-phenylpropionate/trans-cinnamate dioxygenase alpha subunit